MGTDGSVAYLFNKVDILSYEPSVDENALMAAALEVGAEDVTGYDDGAVDVMTTPETYLAIKEALTAAGFQSPCRQPSRLSWMPMTQKNAAIDRPTGRP